VATLKPEPYGGCTYFLGAAICRHNPPFVETTGKLDSDKYVIPEVARRVWKTPLQHWAHEVHDVLHLIEFIGVIMGAGESANGGAARGFEGGGGTCSKGWTPAGGELWTSEGLINQHDFSKIIDEASRAGDQVHLLTGAHGYENGTTEYVSRFYEQDEAAFGLRKGVNVYNLDGMPKEQIIELINGPGTIVAGYCNSGVCLAPYIPNPEE
jgi:hypothetical protein